MSKGYSVIDKHFQFECGKHKGTIKAKTLGIAWRKLTKNKTRGFAPLARVCINGGIWQYITPEALDTCK